MYNSKRINVLVQIRTYWWEKLPKINKHTGTFFRNSRVALEPLQDFSKQHLIKREEPISYWKKYFVYFGEVSTL